MSRRTPLVVATVCLFALAGGRLASAQPTETERIAEEPTGGVTLPTAGISGTADALTSVTNPAGLMMLDGWSFGFALDAGPEDDATGSGAGFGFYYGTTAGGGLLPELGLGLAVEALSPPRVRLDPDPGEPIRLTASSALRLGPSASLGFGWHHFFESDTLGGLDTFDVGLSVRGTRLGFGFVVRDLNAPDVGEIPIQRRYEAELVARPFSTDVLEIAAGGRVGETRGDLDGWLRGSVRLGRGVYLRAEGQTRELQILDASASGAGDDETREYRVSAGIEISFGGIGGAAYGTTRIDDEGRGTFQSGTVVLRLSERQIPSVIAPGKRLERVDLGGPVGQSGLTRVIGYLRSLERDDDVAGVIVKLDGFTAGWSTTREIRQQLAVLRDQGKKVYAYMLNGTTRSYYLASVADKIYVDPAGRIMLQGFAATTMYFKGVFDKLGVEAQFEKIEEFKSAPEAWTRSSPTGAAFEMRNALYDSIYGVIVADIAAGRKISAARVRELIDGGPYSAGDLKGMSELVDAVTEPDELAKLVAEDMGARIAVGSRPSERPERWGYPAIAIIYINGDIFDGQSRTIPLLGRRMVGSDTITAAIRQARADRDIKAIILRINSPGGSATASELMAREVFKTREAKPIICSLGNVAASGGYFAAAGCDKIFSGRMTVTGSIGIFNGKFDVSALLTRLGLSWTTYKRGESADALSFYRPFSPAERATLKDKLRYFYGRFIGAVAEGRGMKEDEVDAVGRGRVWTGEQALPIRLVDEIGGISQAIDEAKRAAGLGLDQRVRIISLPRAKSSLLSQLLGGGIPGLRDDASTGSFFDPRPATDSTLDALLPGDTLRLLREAVPASVWIAPSVPQARLPFSIIWE